MLTMTNCIRLWVLNATAHNNKNNNIGCMRVRFITRQQRWKLRLCLNIRDSSSSSSRTKVNGAAWAGSSGPPVLVTRSAPRFTPQNGAGYLRVVLGEEVSPGCRRGDAYDKYSLDCEEAENTVRLSADRHFPLNIQETGINKRRAGRTVSRSCAKNNRAPEKVCGGRVMVDGGFWTLQPAVESQSETRTQGLAAEEDTGDQDQEDALPPLLMCLAAYLRTRCPPSLSAAAHICSFSLPLSPM